jgi:C4-dicarboxylate-specific signal transduction histidine kinase
MTGADPPGLAGAPAAALVCDEDRADFDDLIRGAADPSQPRQELLLRRQDGACVWGEAAASRILWEGREAVLVSVTNVTERKQAEELALKQEEQLVHSTRLAELGEMAAAISHELNQPLTGIRNYARNAFYMIEKRLGTEEDIKGNLRLISEQVDRASKIINEMRELTRRSDRNFVLLDVNSVVRESVEFLLPQMKLSEVSVHLALAEALPMVLGDRIRLAQVFLNLLTNARHAMEEAPLRRLTVTSRASDGEPASVVVEVADTGKGFSEEEARKLFVPFYTTRKSGHGLGLSISRAIIKDHDGTIEASGAPGKGAVFTVVLPVKGREGTERS